MEAQARQGPCRNLPTVGLNNPVMVGGEVTYCVAPGELQPVLRTQLLIDSSGSMIGFRSAIPQLDSWVRQAVSHANGRIFRLSSQRSCYFSAGRGVFGCSSTGSLAPFNPRGDTNLHEAIRASREADVTVILTDGVSASGTRGSGDCAGGVDAACVARALQAAIQTQPGEPQETDRGVWIVPLAGIYDGTFYTEEFDVKPDLALQHIQDETATVATIGGAVVGTDKKVNFPYKGPRALMLVVIGRPLASGRGFVQALMERAPYAQVQALSPQTGNHPLKNFQRGLAMLPPVEVFPGYAAPVQWVGRPEIPAPKGVRQTCGTIDFAWNAPATLRMDCAASGPNEAIFNLRAQSSRGPAGCMKMQVLPDLRIERQTTAGATPVRGASWTGLEALQLRLACNRDSSFACNSNPYRIAWVGVPDFRAAANCLASPTCSGATASFLRSLSTDTASAFPHRIYGLRETIERFLSTVPSGLRTPIAELRICLGL